MTFNKFLVVSALVLAPAIASAQDWTGAYGGITVGTADIDATVKVTDPQLELQGEGSSAGIFAGYNYQVGNVVYGGEFDLDATDYSIEDGLVRVDSTVRLKARVGTPVGNGLAYGVVGAVGATSNSVVAPLGDFAVEDGIGALYGAGYDLKISENVLIGSELLFHDFEDDVLQVDVTTLRLRVGFAF